MFSTAFRTFLHLRWVTPTAPVLVPRKRLINDVFATFALKNALLSLKTCEKAHIELQQVETKLV